MFRVSLARRGKNIKTDGTMFGTKFSRKASTPNVNAIGPPNIRNATPNAKPVKIATIVFIAR